MTNDPPYLQKNEADYLAVSNQINAALDRIKNDVNEPATLKNLAKLSEVHRNTLYQRSLASSGEKNAYNGSPYRELAEIRESRKLQVTPESEDVLNANPTEAKNTQLEEQLNKLRFKVGWWFVRGVELRRERDELLRQIQLYQQKQTLDANEINRLRKQLQQSLVVIK